MKNKLLTTGLFCLLASCANADSHYPPADLQEVTDSDVISDVGIDIISDPGVNYSPTCPTDASAALSPGAIDFQIYPDEEKMVLRKGKMMTEPVNVYFIWYGNWFHKKALDILPDMIANVDTSSWYKMTTSYYQIDNIGDAATTVYASNKVNFVKSIYVGYSHGIYIRYNDIENIIREEMNSGVLPIDTNGIYFLISSVDVVESGGFCSGYCGWHNSAIINKVNIKYSFVGDVEQCPDSCSVKPNFAKFGFSKSPNDDWSADSMASIMLHELSEAITDPDPVFNPAWIDSYGEENADKCAWTFGNLYLTNNGCSLANVKIGSKDYVIQRNWLLDNKDSNGGYCALHP